MRDIRIFLTRLLWVLLAAGLGAVGQNGNPANAPRYLDPAQPLAARVNDLVSRMTLEEKASQLVNHSRPIPRLQVPEYDWWSEALHGVARAGIATVFPEPIGLASTFDVPLVHTMAVDISTEARAKYNQSIRAGRHVIFEGLDFWSPNINIFRDPRWGRGQETYGEDPFLTGRMGVAFVTGMQGDDPKYYRVIATPKHFAVHSGPETTRHMVNVEVSKHDQEDTYLPAFRAAVTEGRAGSVMCAYNRVNGEPACASRFLLEDQLRGAWQFTGYVVSDCDAVTDIFSGHHFTKTVEEAAAVSLKRGMDNECADFFGGPADNSDYRKYVDGVKQGLLSENDVDVALKRLLTARFRLGLFDPPEMVQYAQTPDSEIDSAAHQQLALRAARESMVLLKNDGVLPLRPDIRKIAVVGPLADSVPVLEGNYNGTPSHPVTALDGIRRQFSAAQITFMPGTNFLRENEVIPTPALSTDDGQPGVKAEYYSDETFTGTPLAVRVDKMIDYQPVEDDPFSVVAPGGRQQFAVRWTGFVTSPESGSYQFGVTRSRSRLWLDGKLIVNDWDRQTATPRTVTVELEKGHKYAVKVEYVSERHGIQLVWLHLVPDTVEQAVASAKQADVVIAVVGITSRLEGEEMKVDLPGFKGGDRTSLDLPKEEEDLLEGLKASGKPVIVVLMNGSALSVNWAKENSNAILEAWYSGEQGGTAIAETLAGANNPAGRLPVTFYKGIEQLPPFDDYSMKNRTYRYFEGQPLYPFGYGLSYSQFAYNHLQLSPSKLNAGDSLNVDAEVKNVSPREGDEVVELYLTFPKSATAPLRALRAFTRIHVAAGETEHVHFTLDPRDLSAVDATGTRSVSEGDYGVTVGGGQPGTEASQVGAEFSIAGNQKLPE
jgi:beta-glucosidase